MQRYAAQIFVVTPIKTCYWFLTAYRLLFAAGFVSVLIYAVE
jgi:hypothetical protein